MSRSALRVLGAAIGLAACGETNAAAIQRLTPAYERHRELVRGIVGSLPPKGSVGEPASPGPFEPGPVFDESGASPAATTAEILEIERLEGGAEELLFIKSPVGVCLDWTSPNREIDEDLAGGRGEVAEICEPPLRRPWLVLLRRVTVAVPAQLRMEGFIVHVPSKKIAASFPINVAGRYTQADLGRGPWVAEARRSADNAFFLAARCELSLQLSRLPGARFSFEGSGCKGDFREIAEPQSEKSGR